MGAVLVANSPRPVLHGVTAGTYTDASLLSLKTAVEKLTVLPPQMAPQILGAAGQTVSQPVAVYPQVKADEIIVDKGEMSHSGAAWQVLSKINKWCALQVSKLQAVAFGFGPPALRLGHFAPWR
jgi:hypothetical protein